MPFGQRLQEVRRKNGMTQEEFAAQLKVSRQAVSKWESCRGYPEIEKIIFICNRYGVTMNELFCEEVPLPGREAQAPEHPERRTLKTALSSFFTNLSPENKWVGAGSLLCVTLLLLLCIKLLKGGVDHMMTFVWIGAIIVFGIVEAATAGLVSIWFVAGAVAALLSLELGAVLWLQIVVFLAVSIAALIATRPLAHKMLDKTIVPTNADRVLHHTAKVTETIDNENTTGAVYIDGKTWTARSEDGDVIARGSMVTIVRMEGVKLFVRKEREEP